MRAEEREEEDELSASDEIVEGESVAVPNKDVDLPKAFDEGKDELLLKDGVLTAVCNGGRG